jgi:nucleotide-binding universal stress UspA family protein
MKPLFQTVVVAVSGSEASVSAAKYAIVFAKQYRCRLVAVNVVDTATLKELRVRAQSRGERPALPQLRRGAGRQEGRRDREGAATGSGVQRNHPRGRGA